MKGKACIIGFGDAYRDKDEYSTALGLMIRAIRATLADCGLTKNDIDGILTGPCPLQDRRRAYNSVIQQELMIAPRLNSEITPHGAGLAASIRYAAMAVMTGVAETVVCVSGESFLAGAAEKRAGNVFGEGDLWFDIPYGAFVPAVYALVAQRYMFEYGVKPEQAAKLAVENRKWALAHPKATMRDKGPITVKDVLESPMITSPFHLLDCAISSRPPGTAGAFIITTAERAKKITDTPIYILGAGERSSHNYLSGRMGVSDSPPSDLWSTITTSAGREAAKEAFKMANLQPKEIDIAEISTQFTYIGMMNLEDCGFCKKGEGGRFIEDGNIDYEDGRLACNTNGGYLSFGQASTSCDLVVEAVRQLRGKALGRQVKDARYALVQSHGGTQATQAILILGNELPR